MYVKGTLSKNYIDTWLFLSLHFICALRTTDLIRIPHPLLPIPPEVVLEQIKKGEFSEKDAKYTLFSVTEHMNTLMLSPNKTKGISGIGSLKFHVPVSLETHMGFLFAIAEAHFQMTETDNSKPLIRVIRDYDRIKRYMGDEIGDLFLEGDFRSRSANKSFLQMIYVLTDDILDDKNDDFHVNGYILAALARSHKGSYGEFANTTKEYLKDAKLSGYNPEFIARELLERGVLSSITSMLLKIITKGEFNHLSVQQQTKVINELSMTPLEAEHSVRLVQDLLNESNEIVRLIYSSKTKKEITEILHSIGNGDAVSKMNESLCLQTAMKKICPFPDRSNCIGCEYEIGTKSTIFLMASELMRLTEAYKKTENEIEKKRYSSIAKKIVAPKMNDLLICMKETYGEDQANIMKEIIQEVSHD